ncbi:MAG: adenylate/guanylate cyclase domain-containing protein [Puniceicoccaceae bacterium]|nr:MAG: adenylate/guanylate cyclase domain-containing protein [Puniceicoccaceae bacterium]
MTMDFIERSYPIAELSFRDFWDICSHFQTIYPEYRHILYSIDGFDSVITLDEPNIAVVMKKIQNKESRIRRVTARFFKSRSFQQESFRLCEIQFRPKLAEQEGFGLSFYGDQIDQVRYYQFEEELYANHPIGQAEEPLVEFGTPCELLAMVIDIRGFSLFCEQPNIESPYTCGLMSAFYDLIQKSLNRFPPNMIKFMGDGVLATWETNANNREIAVNVALHSAMTLHTKWKGVRESPHFSHGVPEGTGVGISFGLASHLRIGNDYIGRPINIASRLCSACPSDRIYVDRAVPALPLHLRKEELGIIIKPYGRHHVWGYFFEDQEGEEKRERSIERRILREPSANG